MSFTPELGQACFGAPWSDFDADWASTGLHAIGLMLGQETYGVDIENDVFVMRKYYWGDDERVAALPNFLHKPSGLEIRWYKYIGRGMSANRRRPGNWGAIVQECIVSLPVATEHAPSLS